MTGGTFPGGGSTTVPRGVILDGLEGVEATAWREHYLKCGFVTVRQMPKDVRMTGFAHAIRVPRGGP